jgi:hypothetical protein
MMMIVEQRHEAKYPSFVWARDIEVRCDGEEIEISGVTTNLGNQMYAAADPVRAYRLAARYASAKQGKHGKNSPHVQFANAESHQERISFLKKYGPLVVCSFHKEDRPVRPEDSFDSLTKCVLVARQNAAELERDHLVYRSALVLTLELRRGEESDIPMIRKCITTIVNNASDWPGQWRRERRLRARRLGYSPKPQWNFGKKQLGVLKDWELDAMREPSGDPTKDALLMSDPVRCGHFVTCELLNAFTPIVYPWGNSAVEAPSWDLAAGIRPLLYYMLRREYLGATGISICRKSDCRKIFEIERSGQEFCDEECSRRQRQREYWHVRGKRLRKRRRDKRRATDCRKGLRRVNDERISSGEF